MSRVVIGVGVGAVSVLVPVYIAELAPPRVRGALVSAFQLLITIGILVAYGVNAAFADTQAWRWSLGLAAVPGVLLALGILAVPESPRWLVTAGRTDQARAVLGRLRGAGGVEAELAEITRVGRENADQGAWRDVFAPRVRRRLVVGMLMAFFAQVCGINAVIYFAPQILQSSGFDTAAALLATVGLGVVNVLLTVVGMLLVDRVGRKPMLAIGVIGMTVSLAVLATTFTVGTGSGWVAFACLAVYIVAYAVSPGMLCFVVISEIFPLRLRGKATSLSLLVNFVANLIVALAFLPMLLALGTAATFWVFAVVCAAFLAFTILLVPETKGRTLEEVERDLG
ncbi:sugar porter (SP) family MFS transporter [Murinocardiopsis flavida]|uniref:Sugar porter (SP) family MFS transporter n=1 Tax=Murinocardiopsis flavida TaxID=645275 RepID=A0A2P8CYW6_9ACTN|nr:sugar porter (SP) family MFS transporter [Murinocardiopsis flavida]